MAKLRNNSPEWKIQPVSVVRSRGARAAARRSDDLPEEFLVEGESEVADRFEAVPPPTRRAGAAAGPLDVSYDLEAGETAVLAVRLPSGALTFHRPIETKTSRARGGPATVRFVVPMPPSSSPAATRGAITRIVKAIVIKVAKAAADKVAGLVITKLVAGVEHRAWRKQGLEEGWKKVTKATLVPGGMLEPGRPRAQGRALLLLHGTFSNAVAAYGELGKTNFFDRLEKLYDGRIYAFDHFSLSRTPEENARMLLEALPEEPTTFDVVTHSRGGLVLRNIVERAPTFAPELAQRFKLGRAVLVASPNEGTPLATPGRWEATVGWMANLLELLPDHPFTTGPAFVANGIVWIARHASGDIPGLHSMDGDGPLVRDLQGPPGPPADAYAALVANFHPQGEFLARMIDTGVDQFFGTANDLVVPTEGGWRIDRTGRSFIPGARIGCFGPGGNLVGDDVTHVGFFSRQPAVDFLVTALAGRRQQLTVLDPAAELPDRRLSRAGAAGIAAPAIVGGRVAAGARGRFAGSGGEAVEEGSRPPSLHVSVVNGDLSFERSPLMVGHYQARKLTGTEWVVDRLLGGVMTRALSVGDYATLPGTHRVFINRFVPDEAPWTMPRPEAVVVVGLGPEGGLRGADLTAAVRQAAVGWARHVREERPRQEGEIVLDLATTLLASGGSGITTAQAAQLIVQGILEANEALHPHAVDGGPTWPRIRSVRIVELYLDRAAEAWRGLKMHAEAMPGRVSLAPVIEEASGALPRPLDAGYRGADYDFISVETRDGGAIAYALDTRRARTEVRGLTPQGRLVRDLVTSASSDPGHDPAIARTLFRLLVPVELESFLGGSTDMQIQLDAGTAGIPWELLDDTNGDGSKEPWAIRTKLLRKLLTSDFRSSVDDAALEDAALVIGEPECPDEYSRLIGAREEARTVFAALSGANGIGAGVERLIRDDAPSVDARAVLDQLFARPWRMVHVAGHGALPGPDGSLGGVVLSNGTFLGPAEIKAMRAVPELVFINCCHLGASSKAAILEVGAVDRNVYDRAQFASGVAQSLIEIGVRCVVAAGWAVDDTGAQVFAETFYQRLLAGARFIDAVHEARRATRDRVYGNTWAAYQCYGDPDWRLRRGGKETAVSLDLQYEGITSIAALKLALETLVVQKKYQRLDADTVRARVEFLKHRWKGAGWRASDGVAEGFARVYADIGANDEAIAWYGAAIDAADGNVSMTALEQRSNLRVRRAWAAVERTLDGAPAGKRKGVRRKSAMKRSRVPASAPAKTFTAARIEIADAMRELEQLRRFGDTSERASLCGSAMKRLALIEAAAGRPEEEMNAIEAMRSHYELAVKIARRHASPDVFYPAANCLAADLALHAGTRGWSLADPSMLVALRESLAAKNEKAPDFWSKVGEIEAALMEAVVSKGVASRAAALCTSYENLHDQLRSVREWASAYDNARFVLGKYGSRVGGAEGTAAQAILELLRSFATTAETKTRRQAARRKRAA